MQSLRDRKRRKISHLHLASWLMMTTSLLTGCSTVPDYANPVEWYKGATGWFTDDAGTDVPKPGSPKGERPDPAQTPDTRKDVAKGLPSDRSGARYAEPVRREATPTKSLSKPQTAPETAAAVPPKPVVQVQPENVAAPAAATPNALATSAARLSPDRRTLTARDEETVPPAAALTGQPPAPANLPQTVAGNQTRLKPIQEQYQRRLAESAQQSIAPGNAVAGYAPSYPRNEEPVHLIPPTSMRGAHAAVSPSVSAPAAKYSLQSSSFQLASLDFSQGGTHLTNADRAAIADVVNVFKKSGGVVRILGLSASDYTLEESVERANTVAAELVRQGVPARKIMVAGDTGQGGALVYLDI